MEACPPAPVCATIEPFNVGASMAPTDLILTTIEMSSHRSMFEYFKRFYSDSNDRYGAQFDMLLGAYCNTLSLVRFLETGLSVACVCTRAQDLLYMREGTIQFEIQQPMIAREGPNPADQPVHNYMVKRVCKRSLGAAFVVAAEAMSLLSEVSLDGTEISEHLRLRAAAQLARNVRVVLDSFERGSVHQVLRLLIEKAPPAQLLVPLSRSVAEGRLNTAVVKANLVSELKRRMRTDSFVMSKSNRSRESVLTMLADMVGATNRTIAVPRLTHADSRGRIVDGVLVTTNAVRQRLLSGFLDLVGTTASVPVTYGELVVTGTNLVTALVMGKAINHMDDVARHLLNMREEEAAAGADEALASLEERPQTATVPAELVQIGDKLVFLEALERRVYQATNVHYPLINTMDLTFVMPLGIYQAPDDRYARHGGDYSPEPGKADRRVFPPKKLYFYNKDGALIDLSFSDAIGTLCHASFLDVEPTLRAIRDNPPGETACVFGTYVTTPPSTPLDEATRRFLEGWWEMLPENPRWVTEQRTTTEQFLAPGNRMLCMELHPAFDFFVALGDVDLPGPQNVPQVMSSTLATWRVCNGNIQLSLCRADFRDARGAELASTRHRMSPATVEAVEGAFKDACYPTALYLVEAMVHGSERNFGVMMRLIIQCIRSYWDNCRRAAFVNSFPMVAYINAYLCCGELPDDCAAVYRDLMEHVKALRAVVTDFTCHGDPLCGQSQEELNHALVDGTVMSPLIWDCDALIYRRTAARSRDAYLNVGGEGNFTMRTHVGLLQDADFSRVGNMLIHNRPIRGADETGDGMIPHHDEEWQVMCKIYYYCIVPAFAKGDCCTMGVRYDNVYATAQAVVIPDVDKDDDPPMGPEDPRHPLNGRHLVPNSMNVIMHNGRMSVDAEALLTIQEVINNMAERTTAILTWSGPDAGSSAPATRCMRTFDGTLHHGILMMASTKADETVTSGTYFYPVPVNALFAGPDHVGASPGISPAAKEAARDVPAVPTFCGANYYATCRQPMAEYVKHSSKDPNVTSYSMMAQFFKLSPLALYHQLRHNFHPGFALTVVRMDRFVAESALFSERASESYFFGQLAVTRRPHAGGVQFNLTQPRAHVDLGVGYTATVAPLLLRGALTDMGNASQSLYLTRGCAPLTDLAADEALRSLATKGQKMAPQHKVPFLGTLMPNAPAGLDRGQVALCEFIVTPVSADLEYFKLPCNPRGRAAGTVYAGDDPCDPDDVMYDHTQGDPSYPFRATNNPWASQRFSYGDRLYNGAYNLSGASPSFSPCYKFFTTSEVIGKTRSLVKLISEAGASLTSCSSDAETQFKRPPGSTELSEDPCALFQEGYPTLCATDKALLRTLTSSEPDNPETHMAQYLIRDGSPIAGCVPYS